MRKHYHSPAFIGLAVLVGIGAPSITMARTNRGAIHHGELIVLECAAPYIAGQGFLWPAHDLPRAGTIPIRTGPMIPGPPSKELYYLDGMTHNGTVGLAPRRGHPFTGTRWKVVASARPGIVHLHCEGHLPGPRWLDGRTHNGTVGLAPRRGHPFTGTQWKVVPSARPGLVHLHCEGHLPGPRWLDGLTGSRSVGLAPRTDGHYIGTYWRIIRIGGSNGGAEAAGLRLPGHAPMRTLGGTL
jgi:hypothetical protein